MTAKEKVLKVWPNAYAHQYGVLVGLGAPKPFTYQIFSLERALSWGFDEEEAAWQNAAESLPAQPERPDLCEICGRGIAGHRDGKCYPDTFPNEPAVAPQAPAHRQARIICDDTGCGEWNCDDCHPETKFPVAPVEAKEKVCPACHEVKSKCKDNEYCSYPWYEPKPTPSTPAEARCLNCDAVYGDHWGPQNHCREGGEETWRQAVAEGKDRYAVHLQNAIEALKSYGGKG